VPLRDDTGVFDTLVMRGGAVIVSMVNAEAPSAVLPQGAVPFSVIWLLVATLETIREGSALVLVGLIFGDSMCFQTVFSFDVAPLVLWWSLGSKDMW